MTPTLFLAAAAESLIAQVVTTVVAFFIVLWVLWKLAWNPIIQHLDQRKNTIIQSWEEIEGKQAKLDSQIQDYNERLRQIDSEARERLNKAIDEGKRTAAELLEESRRQSDELKQKAKADIAVEIDKARAQLRDDVADLTIKATERLLREELDDAKHRELVQDFIKELQQREAS